MRHTTFLASILGCAACAGGGDTMMDAASGTRISDAPLSAAGSSAASSLGTAGMTGSPGVPGSMLGTATAGTQAMNGSSTVAGSAGSTAAGMGLPSTGQMAPGSIGAMGVGPGSEPAASAAGSGATQTPTLTLEDCPAPPAEADAASVAALNAVNKLRVAAGAACASLDMKIVQAASAHCSYFQMNKGGDAMCTGNAHMEVMGCPGFTGESPVDRMRAAGFMGFGGGEVMAFVNDPERAVQTWVDSVWHRLPILDPTTTVLGYGSTGSPANCDTIDFGPGNRSAASTVIVYPYDGQVDVTTTFDGSREGPMPPAPPTGWPSANPITLYAQQPMITEHVLTVDGTTEPIEHVWLDANSDLLDASNKSFLRASVFMYANKPYMPNTKYRVRMAGTHAGGAIEKEWTFTTGAAPTWPRF